MWEERSAAVQAFTDAVSERDLDATLAGSHPEIEFYSLMAQLEARPYRGHGGIRRYFRDIEATWDEWRIEVEDLLPTPDGRVVAVMSTHMRGKGSGVPFVQRLAQIWEFEDGKLRRGTLYRDVDEAVRVVEAPS